MRQAGHHCVGGFCIICSTGLLMQEDLKDTQLFLPLLLSLPIFFSPSKMSSLFSHKFITLSSALKKKKKRAMEVSGLASCHQQKVLRYLQLPGHSTFWTGGRGAVLMVTESVWRQGGAAMSRMQKHRVCTLDGAWGTALLCRGPLWPRYEACDAVCLPRSSFYSATWSVLKLLLF